MSKRTLESFFAPPNKKAKVSISKHAFTPPVPSSKSTRQSQPPTLDQCTAHPSYPWSIPNLPSHILSSISQLAAAQGSHMTNQPHLDLLHFQPFIPSPVAEDLFQHLRSNLFFHRVSYPITRNGISTTVATPRYTTVFGVDDTSTWRGGLLYEVSPPEMLIAKTKYKCAPRPIPPSLDHLRCITSAATNTSYNICLVNYYANGNDSIAYHSDDEYFLEREPAIASFSLGAKRDFLMKHKPITGSDGKSTSPCPGTSTLKISLGSGDMILMRGSTQANWLHSIPKRKGLDADKGRINITLRKAMIPAGTENYYRYNVGSGGTYEWDASRKEMVLWEGRIE